MLHLTMAHPHKPVTLSDIQDLCESKIKSGMLVGIAHENHVGWRVAPYGRIPLHGDRLLTEFFTPPRHIGRAAKSKISAGVFVTFRFVDQEKWPDPANPRNHPIAHIEGVVTKEEAKAIAARIEGEMLRPRLEALQAYEDRLTETERTLAARQHGLDAESLRLGEEKNRLSELDSSIQQKSDEVTERERELDGWQRLLGIPTEIKPAYASPEALIPLSPVVLENYRTHLARHGYEAEGDVADRFLIAVLVAALNGRFVLLSGPVGTGKTSIVRATATFLGPRSATVVPVRPGWLDPSDLFGYLNPIDGKFIETPFTASLLEIGEPETVAFVCLDEMNIARIENYAADLLSNLEYGREGYREVRLFSSPGINPRLRAFQRHAHSLSEGTQPVLSDKEQSELQRISESLFQPSSLRIGKNVVFFGTLNSDESTYQISPKMVDRSLVVRFPRLDIRKVRLRGSEGIRPEKENNYVEIDSLRKEVVSMHDAAHALLSEMATENLLPPDGACVDMGHRVVQDLASIILVCDKVGMRHAAKAQFLALKVLPRIYLSNKDREDSVQDLRVFLRRVSDAEGSLAPMVKGLEDQLNDPGCASVSYWHVV